MYVCVLTNTTRNLSIELIPNLMLPEYHTFPTADDADRLKTNLMIVNSKFMKLINQQAEFEQKEQEGLEVLSLQQANLRVETSLKHMLLVELAVIAVIGVGQYLVMRRFVNRLGKMH